MYREVLNFGALLQQVFKAIMNYLGDVAMVRDIARATVVLNTLEDVLVFVEAIRRDPYLIITRVKNRFDPDYDAIAGGGYRDLQLLLLVWASPACVWRYAELQINLAKIVRIKKGVVYHTGKVNRFTTKEGTREKRSQAEVIGMMVQLAMEHGQDLKHLSSLRCGRGHEGFQEAREMDAFSRRTIRYHGAPAPTVFELVAGGALLELDLSRQSSIKLPDVYNSLAKALASPLCRLRKLIVAADHIREGYGDEPAIAILANVPKELTLLSLACFDIRLPGALSLAVALKKTPLLKSLDLYSNKHIPEAGWIAIMDALPTTLRKLDLYDCNITDNTWRMFQVNLPHFPAGPVITT